MSQALFQPLYPACGVECAVRAHLLPGPDPPPVLATSAANVLSLYILDAERERLHVFATYELSGNPVSMLAVRFPRRERDALVLSFEEAKMSVVDLDPETLSLRTLYIVSFESAEYKVDRTNYERVPQLRAEPGGQCIAMGIYDTSLAVLPVRQEQSILEMDEGAAVEASGGRAADASGVGEDVTPELVFEPYVLDLRDLGIANLHDFAFLEGYYEPTLLFLHEPRLSFATRLPVRDRTVALTAVSLDLSARSHHSIWNEEGLPVDLSYALPVPEPLGGALLIGACRVMHVSQTGRFTLPLNVFAWTDYEAHSGDTSLAHVVLDVAFAEFLSPTSVFVAQKSGARHVLRIVGDTRSVSEMELLRCDSGAPACCLAGLGDGRVFVGSRLGDSELLSVTLQHDEGEAAAEGMDVAGPADEDTDSSDMEEEDELEAEVLRLKHKTEAERRVARTYRIEVCDTLLNIGPIRSFTLGEHPAEVDGASRRCKLVACSGHDGTGALSVVMRGVYPEIRHSFELPGCCDVWELSSRPGGGAEEEDWGDVATTYLLLTRPDSSTLLTVGADLQEVVDLRDFRRNARTLAAGSIRGGRLLVQATLREICVLAGLRKMCSFEVEESIVALRFYADGLVARLTGGGFVWLRTWLGTTPGDPPLIALESVALPDTASITAFAVVSGVAVALGLDLREGDFAPMLFVTRIGGALEIYDLGVDGIQPLLLCAAPNIAVGPAEATCGPVLVPEQQQRRGGGPPWWIDELHVAGGRAPGESAFLLARVLPAEETYVYRSMYMAGSNAPLRWLRHDPRMLLRPPSVLRQAQQQTPGELRTEFRAPLFVSLPPMQPALPYGAVVMCGARPLFIVMLRHFARVHRLAPSAGLLPLGGPEVDRLTPVEPTQAPILGVLCCGVVCAAPRPGGEGVEAPTT